MEKMVDRNIVQQAEEQNEYRRIQRIQSGTGAAGYICGCVDV